ncbi:hypothetical protein NBRC116493_11080 [Aurantivibrio infirmus]
MALEKRSTEFGDFELSFTEHFWMSVIAFPLFFLFAKVGQFNLEIIDMLRLKGQFAAIVG